MELSNAEWWDNEELQWLEREIQELEDELDGEEGRDGFPAWLFEVRTQIIDEVTYRR